MSWILALFTGLWLAAAGGAGVPPADGGGARTTLTILATADFHGALEPRHVSMVGGREVGGIDIIASVFEAVRRSNPGGVVLLDAGDLYQGTLLSAASEGASVVEFYNDVGYDAVAVGNHDFDFGPIGYHSIPLSPGDDPLGSFKARLLQARFPFLAANILDRATGKPLALKNLHPYVLLRRRGVVLAVIGLTSVDLPLTTHPANVRGLEVRPLLTTLRPLLSEVRARGATVVVLVAHAGIAVDEGSGSFVGPMAELAAALAPGEVDLIVSGHRHLPVVARVNGTPLLQSWAHGIAYTRADLTIDLASGKVVPDGVVLHENQFFFRSASQGKPASIGSEPPKPDKRYARKLERFRRSVAHLQSIRLGRAEAELAHHCSLDSPVGNLVTDAMRASDPTIEIAMYNSGGLRTSIPRGVITFGRIFEVVPFDNNLIKLRLTGAQIREVLEHGLNGPYGVMEISGLRVVFSDDAPLQRHCLEIALSDDQPLIDDASYLVATNEFLLNGGDGYFTFAHGKDVQNTFTLIRELVARYIKDTGTVVPDSGGRYLARRGADSSEQPDR